MAILVLNCGSSSIKFQLFHPRDDTELLRGAAEGIGEREGRFHCLATVSGQRRDESQRLLLKDHRAALGLIMESLGTADISAVGHRVVHGGEHFRQTTLLDPPTLHALADLDALAPLHNPANRLGITTAMELFPGVPQVAVFDTAFHASLPDAASHYAIPAEWRERWGVRRFGFHGISHQYITLETARLLGLPLAATNLVSLHLGNGASAAAVQGGRSVDTTMGMTPLEGLVMGTRSGDIDPGALLYLLRNGLDVETLDRGLNRESGLLGLCGDNDMRAVTARAAQDDADATRALAVYCYRIRKTIGAYCAALGRVDALVFTAGVGENNPALREAILEGLDGFGIAIDPALNREAGDAARALHAADSAVAVLVIPTREELQIAREVRALIGGAA